MINTHLIDEIITESYSTNQNANRLFTVSGILIIEPPFKGTSQVWRDDNFSIHLTKLFTPQDLIHGPINLTCSVTQWDSTITPIKNKSGFDVKEIQAQYDDIVRKILIKGKLSIKGNDSIMFKLSFQVTFLATIASGTVHLLNKFQSQEAQINSLAVTDGFVSKLNTSSLKTDNLYINDQDNVRKIIYVRLSGDDLSGNGTEPLPYRTFKRATQDIPLVLRGQRIFIDCTGIGTEDLGSGFNMPGVIGEGVFVDTGKSPFHPYISGGEFDITIFAIPDELEKIEEKPGVSITFDHNPITNLRTITDNSKAWKTDQFKGKIAVGAVDPDPTNPYKTVSGVAAITGNTDKSIELAIDYDLILPISIVEPSAHLRITDMNSEDNFNFQSVFASVGMYGIKFTHANIGLYNVHIYPLVIQNVPNFYLQGCILEGMFVQNNCNVSCQGVVVINSTEDTYINNYRRLRIEGGILLMSWCFLKKIYLEQRYSDRWNFFTGVIENCSPFGDVSGSAIGHSAEHELLSKVNFFIDFSVIRDSMNDGIWCLAGSNSYVGAVQIDNSNGNGIRVIGANRLIVNKCAGTGNRGYGIYIEDGGHVYADNPLDTMTHDSNYPCSISGISGDIKVGMLPERKWDDLINNPPKANQFDYKGDGSRLSWGDPSKIEVMP